MKWKKGWKVLNEDRTSVWIEGYGSRKYPPNKVVGRSPNCGPLCVFKNKTSALRFMTPGDRLVPCLWLPSKHNTAWVPAHDPTYLDELPEGTALAEKVKCLA